MPPRPGAGPGGSRAVRCGRSRPHPATRDPVRAAGCQHRGRQQAPAPGAVVGQDHRQRQRVGGADTSVPARGVTPNATAVEMGRPARARRRRADPRPAASSCRPSCTRCPGRRRRRAGWPPGIAASRVARAVRFIGRPICLGFVQCWDTIVPGPPSGCPPFVAGLSKVCLGWSRVHREARRRAHRPPRRHASHVG